ncbi:Smr/MutS family protein [Herbaspirillum sp. RTI4]|uniref:Smr/MutS family protein n=1 Tax=Herbaspirillum sp. RTI4 TaxID=3048640 RepID=UPI002AB46DC1|nr:Smr/MutS family protein [Herbaspirillum sp. RTI4]MDY7579454.1 Smr/MutS family protein [Herbaspirillum sp. RTI4]MEA9980368.1 Smr/MutS family protein [Herbaspirillum sp. RTI4]
MPASIKDFTDLKSLRRDLQAQEKTRREAEALRLIQQEQLRVEADLFRSSIGIVAPLPGNGKLPPVPARPLPIARHHLADEQAALMESISDDFTAETLIESDASLSFARNGVSLEVVRKLRRGHWTIQAQLDLHGMRREEARDSLGEFLRQARQGGLRCVRVIHGKGLGSVNREPVLKEKVRNWLAQKEEVMAFCQARAADGGSGALVVLLKSGTSAA